LLKTIVSLKKEKNPIDAMLA